MDPTVSPGGPCLSIENPEGSPASHWERETAPPPPGRLARFHGHVEAETPGGWAELRVKAVGPAGEELDASSEVFVRAPGVPDLSPDLEVKLVVPEQTACLRLEAALTGAGKASFSHFRLTDEAADLHGLNGELIARLKASDAIRTGAVEAAFRSVFRHHFVPGHNWGEAYADRVIMTHHGENGGPVSSASQPYVVAAMLERLQVEPGMRVLEIGAGTGFNAALLAHLTGDPSTVWTTDLDEILCAEARQHLHAASCDGVHVLCRDGWDGCPEAAPFDRIIVTAQAPEIAPAWFDQLREGGQLVLPWGPVGAHQRTLVLRKAGDRLELEESLAFGFMPLRGPAGRPGYRDADGTYWDASSLDREQIECAARMLAGECWTRPCAALEATASANLMHLSFFLSLEEPRLAARMPRIDDAKREMSLLLMDLEGEAACCLDPASPHCIRGWGDPAVAEAMEAHVRRWVACGRPGPEQLRFTAFPPGAAPPPASGERLVSHRCFDYLVLWEAGVSG